MWLGLLIGYIALCGLVCLFMRMAKP